MDGQNKRIEKLPPDRMLEIGERVELMARRDRHQALAEYATHHAGTIADLDEALEAASHEHLLDNALPDGRATAPCPPSLEESRS